MKNRKRLVSILAGIMAAIMLLTLIIGLIPTPANAYSSSEIRKQINELKKQKSEIEAQIKDVKEQYKQNENEIADIVARKNVIDQEIGLLKAQILNINEQISAFNVLIADKQDELDHAEERYNELNEQNKERIRAMEEDGSVTYWEVLFKANDFSDLLDRLNMVEEIAASDQRRLKELAEAADHVEEAQQELELEKADLQDAKAELDATQVQLDEKREEADALLMELLAKGEELEQLEKDFLVQKTEFLDAIAAKEQEYNQAKLEEWLAYMATYTTVPPATQAPVGGGTTSSNNGGGNGGGGGVGHVMRHHDLHQILVVHGLARGRRGGGGRKRRGAAALNAGIHIGLVVIADIEDVLVALHRAAERLQADIHGAAVTGDHNHLGVIVALVPEAVGNAGGDRSGVFEIALNTGHRDGGLGTRAGELRRASGRNHQNGVVAQNIKNIAENHIDHAALAGADAGRDRAFRLYLISQHGTSTSLKFIALSFTSNHLTQLSALPSQTASSSPKIFRKEPSEISRPAMPPIKSKIFASLP